MFLSSHAFNIQRALVLSPEPEYTSVNGEGNVNNDSVDMCGIAGIVGRPHLETVASLYHNRTAENALEVTIYALRLLPIFNVILT